MKKMNKTIPKFKNEDEEREFWATHSPLDYFDATTFKRVSFPKLRPSLKSISIRLPEDMLAELKTLANKKDVPYQSLAKIYLARQIALERGFFRSAQKKRRRKTGTQQVT
ncbi:MAG: BrnA antitoxin family protein [Deltaproteobacteria bacterium]|nr:BrnA antitoxin family protein [Deltaproteobacteria bacterium]MBW2138955.1 BrnA antitoxin family protein [Deltaproteobacteria bacterium]